jgi:hypothetical protein
MEPEDSGRWKTTPGTIMVGMPPREVDRIIRTDVAAIPHAEGVNNHMGSRATADPALMRSVMASLRGTGLYFLDSRTSKFTVAHQAARDAGLKSAERSVFLDDVDEPGAIMIQLDQLVTRAGQEGALVGIGHLRANTIKVLAERIPYWESRGVRFRPLREVVR